MGTGTLYRQLGRWQHGVATDEMGENRLDGQCSRDHIRTDHPDYENLDPVTLLEAFRPKPEERHILLHPTAGLLQHSILHRNHAG